MKAGGLLPSAKMAAAREAIPRGGRREGGGVGGGSAPPQAILDGGGGGGKGGERLAVLGRHGFAPRGRAEQGEGGDPLGLREASAQPRTVPRGV